MNINRHNYEEFFLLYVDKELSAADRKAVDMFVHENRDLKIELDLLQQTVLKADDIVLDKKDWLFMEKDISALQENLLLYVDDELNVADKKSIESLLVADKAVQAEWKILQQTKLQPDTSVVFENKELLYRKEAGRIVSIKWWRAAAAAVLLGFGLWAGMAVYNNYNIAASSTELANSKNQKTESVKKVAPVNEIATIAVPEVKQTPDNIASTKVQGNKNTAVKESIKPVALKSINESIVTINENTTVQNNNKKISNNLPESHLDNINSNGSNETIAATVIPENNNSNRVSGNSNVVSRSNPKESNSIGNSDRGIVEKLNNSVAAMQAVNKSSETESGGRYINLEDDKEKRTGFGGFLRKAKRVIERTANINTGEGIKVAGFEIALK